MTHDPAASSRPTRRVLVVCAGNICRSPTAEAVIRRLGASHPVVDFEVRSRGTQNWNVGKHAHPAMTRIAAERGYDLSRHVAAQVTTDDLAWADDVLVMDDENRQQLVARHPDLAQRVRLLDSRSIPDPWLVDEDPAYTDSLDRIELAVRTYLASLEPNAEQRGPRP
ncbi:MAG TPA: low molecular weight protein-tyrosine-phosphatase [Actinomycetes bacterium]|nr:low molecular weight protein-tyrosine-phosphatase [Actinomycetes bacterium]